MGLFETILHDASIHGITFPVSRRTMRGGRDKARRAYPHRPGQDTEDTGRRSRVFELEVPLFAGIDPELYPTTYESLVAAFESEETLGDVEYVDPFWGPLPVSLIEYEDITTADERDGVRLRLTIETREHEDVLFRVDAMRDAQARARADASALDEALEIAGISESDILEAWDAIGAPLDFVFDAGDLFVDAVDSFFTAIEEVAMSFDDIAWRLDQIRERIDAVNNFDAAQEASNWSIVRSSTSLASSVTLATEQRFEDIPIVEWVVPAQMSHIEIAVALYGDESRASEIVQRNPWQVPLAYPAGRILQVLAE